MDAVAAVTDYTVVSDGERLALLELLLAVAPMSPPAAGAARRIWQAFPDVPLAASDYSAMWERCDVAGAGLPESWLGAGAGHTSFTLEENVHGSDFVAEVAYGYRITRDAITVKVGYTFTPDAGVTVPEAAWFGFIRNVEPLHGREPGGPHPDAPDRVPAGPGGGPRGRRARGHGTGQRRRVLPG